MPTLIELMSSFPELDDLTPEEWKSFQAIRKMSWGKPGTRISYPHVFHQLLSNNNQINIQPKNLEKILLAFKTIDSLSAWIHEVKGLDSTQNPVTVLTEYFLRKQNSVSELQKIQKKLQIFSQYHKTTEIGYIEEALQNAISKLQNKEENKNVTEFTDSIIQKEANFIQSDHVYEIKIDIQEINNSLKKPLTQIEKELEQLRINLEEELKQNEDLWMFYYVRKGTLRGLTAEEALLKHFNELQHENQYLDKFRDQTISPLVKEQKSNLRNLISENKTFEQNLIRYQQYITLKKDIEVIKSKPNATSLFNLRKHFIEMKDATSDKTLGDIQSVFSYAYRIPNTLQGILDGILTVPALTEKEKEIFKDVNDITRHLPSAKDEVVADLFEESLIKHKERLGATSERIKHISPHIALMDNILRFFGIAPHFSGGSGLSLHYSGSKVGGDEVIPYVIKSLPNDINYLNKILTKLNQMPDTEVYSPGYQYYFVTLSVALTNKIESLKHRDPIEVHPKIQDAVFLFSQYEEELIALTKIQLTNNEYLESLQKTIETECDKEVITSNYSNISLEQETPSGIKRITQPGLSISALIEDSIINKNGVAALAISKNEKLKTALDQYQVVGEINRNLTKQNQNPRVILQEISDTLYQNEKLFKTEDGPTKQFFKRIVEALTFGLAKKLWKKTKGEEFLEKAGTLFSSAKQKSEEEPTKPSKQPRQYH